MSRNKHQENPKKAYNCSVEINSSWCFFTWIITIDSPLKLKILTLKIHEIHGMSRNFQFELSVSWLKKFRKYWSNYKLTPLNILLPKFNEATVQSTMKIGEEINSSNFFHRCWQKISFFNLLHQYSTKNNWRLVKFYLVPNFERYSKQMIYFQNFQQYKQ